MRPKGVLTCAVVVLVLLASSCTNEAKPKEKEGSWNALPDPKVASRSAHTATWTGEAMIVWGGLGTAGALADGTIYDPGTDSWAAVPQAPIKARGRHAAVWTDAELLLWGGRAGVAGAESFADGAGYSPTTGQWRTIQRSPLQARSGHSALWTGSLMIVWGGEASDGAPFGDGASYDPGSGRWTPLPAAPLGPRADHVTTWNGREMIVWGGRRGVGPQATPLLDGAAFDVASKRWRAISPSPLTGTPGRSAVWTGSAMIVSATNGPSGRHAAYEPRTDAWKLLADSPLDDRSGEVASWTGTEMVVTGGVRAGGSVGLPDDGVYDVAKDAWIPLQDSAARGCIDHSVAWTGVLLIVFGCGHIEGSVTPLAAAFRPR